MSTIFTNYQTFIPSSGDTITLGDSDMGNVVVIAPATDLAALTIQMPGNPHAGQQVSILTTKNITAVTFTGGSFNSTPANLTANGYTTFIFDVLNMYWMNSGRDDTTDMSQVHRLWVNAVRQVNVKEIATSATVSGGNAVFYLTDNNLSTGNAVMSTVFKESANFWVDDKTTQFQYGSYTLSADKKTLTIGVNRLGSVVAGLINFVSAANGTTVYLTIKGT